MIWEAWEPKIALDPKSACDWLLANGSDTMPLSGAIARKTMRRVCDLRDPHALDLAIQFIASATGKSAALAVAALDGLLEGQRGKAMVPASPTSEFIAKLLAFNDPAVRDRAQKLGALWGDAAAMQASVNLVNDTSVSVDERIRAIQVVRQLKNDAAREAMLKATAPGNPEPVILEAIRALAEIGGDLVSERLLGGWKSFSPAVRRAGAEVLATRDRWASNLLSAIERKDIPPDDISPVAIRTLTRSAADYGMLAKRAAQVFGRVRDADKDKLKVINAKKQMILGISTPPDIEAGHEIAKKTCFVCHKLYGEGADVGPDLTGVGRSTIDALLANVIDPNQIIGAGYEMVEVETKDGRSVSGRMMENTDSRVRLLSAGPKEDVIARADVASLRVSELSVMPEGLEQMPDNDFRNLVAFILNPPGDHQPFNWKNDAGHSDTSPTKTKPAKSEGVTKKSAAAYPPIDHESVALWNPEWTVTCPDFQGVPAKLTDYHGRKNVLVTHPVSRTEPSYLERTIKLPATGKSALSFAVASHDKGDWELHVLANGSLLHKQLIGHDGERWKSVNVDLTTFAGKEVKLRLENAANDWSWEFGYWSDIRLSSEAGATVAEK
jgi:putative heme-binding domain-containing protein